MTDIGLEKYCSLAWIGAILDMGWFLSSLRSMVVTFRGDINLIISGISVMSSSVRLTMLLHFIFLDSRVFNTAGGCCQKNSNISRVLFLFVVCLKHYNAIFQLRPCPGLGVTMDMKVQVVMSRNMTSRHKRFGIFN